MEIKVLASGSSGNAYIIGQMKVLHDCRGEVKQQKALKLERLAEKIAEARRKKQRGFELMAVVRCRDCVHYGECGDCDVHPHDGRFNQDYFCADAERSLAEDWRDFEKGTNREDIWHWFDEHHSQGVAFLMYGRTQE